MTSGERHICPETGKAIFHTKHAALDSLTGQLRSKTVRVYPCPEHPGHLHLTKEKVTKLRGNRS